MPRTAREHVIRSRDGLCRVRPQGDVQKRIADWFRRALGRKALGVVALSAWSLNGCIVEPVVLGADLCASVECGTELEVPARLCGDGSHGGYTGRCMRDETVSACHWEILDCPPLPSCAPRDCGTFPTAFAGSTDVVQCRRTADGVCRWTLQSGTGCRIEDCGVVPEAARTTLCRDGSLGGFTGDCVSNGMGACVWEEIMCGVGTVAVAPCSLAECGEQPAADLLACADGSVAGLTDQCLRQDDGVCRWATSDCAPAECDDDAACGTNAYCDRSTVACNSMIRGYCATRPASCEGVASAQVCGCDGTTYASECEAARLGVSVAEPGPCP